MEVSQVSTIHQESETTKVCSICHEEYCSDCISMVNGQTICLNCKNKQRNRNIRSVCIAFVAILILSVAIIGPGINKSENDQNKIVSTDNNKKVMINQKLTQY